MIYLTVDQIVAGALDPFQSLDAEAPDGSCALWDSHRLLAFTSPSKSAPRIIQRAAIKVAGLGDSDLEPIRNKLRSAGYERGLCL